MPNQKGEHQLPKKCRETTQVSADNYPVTGG